MIEATLTRTLFDAVKAAAADLGLDPTSLPEPTVERPRQKEHGDWSTNVALVLASAARRPPRDVAEAIAARIEKTGHVRHVEVAGPGFINLFLGPGWLHDALGEILERGDEYGRAAHANDRVQVEFVSPNPTGPLHIGTARNAAIGDALSNLLEFSRHEVSRECYLNDAGRQMDLFAESVEARYLQLAGMEADVPQDGYHGAYIVDLAVRIRERLGDELVEMDATERRARLRTEAFHATVAGLRETLERFNVRVDNWFSERTLHDSGAVASVVTRLLDSGHAYEADGAIWFRATDFGDDKDRVLVRSNGVPTYFAADCAYLLDKIARGFDRLIYVWGADHHGDMKRMYGAAEALDIDPKRLWILLYQLVNLYRGGEPVRMSKRTGEVVTLDELLDEVGADAARYTLVSRSADSPLDFDIEVVTRQTLDNPVYYVQYAHARIASLIRVAQAQGVELRPWEDTDFGRLKEDAELELLGVLSEFPGVVELAATTLAPHRLTRYVEQLATAFHRFYSDWRVITDDDELTQARLWLSNATRQVLATGLRLIGVAAPESMERLSDQSE